MFNNSICIAVYAEVYLYLSYFVLKRAKTKSFQLKDNQSKLVEMEQEIVLEYETALGRPSLTAELDYFKSFSVQSGQSKVAFKENRAIIARQLLKLHPSIQRAVVDLQANLISIRFNPTPLHGYSLSCFNEYNWLFNKEE